MPYQGFQAEAFLRDVLGARNIEERGDELIHSCLLPFGLHSRGDSTPSASLNVEKLVANCYVCLAGEERALTKDGPVPLRDLSGGFHELLTTGGEWVKAEVKSFGVQPLMKVVVSRNKRERTIYATPEHGWVLQVGHRRIRARATTRELLPGHRLASVMPAIPEGREIHAEWVARGFAFGNGSRVSGKSCKAPLTVSGLPADYKNRPSLDAPPSALYGWLAGYFAADGSVSKDGQATLSSVRRSDLEFARVLCDRIGVGTWEIREQLRLGYGASPTPLYSVGLVGSTLDSEFFVIPEHRRRYEARANHYERLGWIVKSVEPTNRVEEVFCAVVPGTNAFALEDHLLTSNCGGGTLLWYVEHVLGVSAAEARRLIEQNLSPSSVTREQFLEQVERYWAESEDYGMPEYSFRLLDAWACHTRYMDSRGISREVQDRMRTGLNRDNVEKIGGHLVRQPRVVIPHVFGGKLRGWTMRKIDPRQAGPKWLHSPRMPKHRTLYNWDGTVGGPEVIVVESPMSVLWMMTCGIDNVVATFGRAVPDSQLELLGRGGFRDIVLFPDGDLAGYRMLRSRDRRGREVGVAAKLCRVANVWIVDHGLEGGRFNEKDPANYSAEELRRLLGARQPEFEWAWQPPPPRGGTRVPPGA